MSSKTAADAGLRDPAQLFFQRDGVRRSIILAYWVVIFLALPLWWYTTSIERLPLPSSAVASLSQRQLTVPVRIKIESRSNSASIASSLQNLVPSLIPVEKRQGLHVEVFDDRGQNCETCYQVVDGTEEPVVQGRKLQYALTPSKIPELAQILSSLIMPYTDSAEGYRIAQFSPRYRLSFTLLNEDAAAGNFAAGWDVSNAVNRHITPIFERLAILHSFTVESQVQFHAPLAFSPRPLHDSHGITPEDLTVFVNSAEWTLSSSVSNDPVLHFILFIPSQNRRPLVILDRQGVPSDSTAFLLPQWGGIYILNDPSGEVPSYLSTQVLQPVFSTFANQLLALLGVPKLHPGIKSQAQAAITDWQLDALMRRRLLENERGSRDTLQSIINLVDKIENMPVHMKVKNAVQEALSALEKMYASSKASLQDALRYSAQATTLSSQAFFDPGMLALLYFPAEHTYAVYTPLFASAMIPLMVAALKELRSWRLEGRAVRTAS